jgi:glycogen(starch) synthase
MREGLTFSRLFMTADAVGGVFQYALDLARGLATRGVSTTLAMTGPPMDESRRALAARIDGLALVETGLPLDWLAPDAQSIGAAAREIARLAALHRAEAIHLNAPALAIADFAAPVVVAAHSCLASWWASVKSGEPPHDFIWRTRLTARGFEAADAIVCPSRAFARELAAIYGCQPLAVHNGRASDALASRLEGEPAPWAFAAGRLWDEGKNISCLDEAAAETDVPIFAAGPLRGPNGSRIRPRHLRTLGPLDEPALRARLARRPIFVSAALYEPFGLTILEAAQAGCAMALSDIATLRELWGGAALFAPPRDPHAFARNIERLAREPSLRAALGAAARRRAETYTVEAMAARMHELYLSLLEKSARLRQGAAA